MTKTIYHCACGAKIDVKLDGKGRATLSNGIKKAKKQRRLFCPNCRRKIDIDNIR